MTDIEIIDLARKTLDKGLYFGDGHITRATDAEIITFAKEITQQITANNERFKALLRQIGYPKRGTDEENMDIYDAAKLIQSNFSVDDL